MSQSNRLISEYKKFKASIKKRLGEFRSLQSCGNERIFSELCYCILTANANAVKCAEAVKSLEGEGLLLKGDAYRIIPHIKGRVRFHNKKADYIVLARKLMKRGKCLDVKKHIDPCDVIKTREWLVKNVKGFSYKEASHFLRNIGLGKDIAILDRHILKNLKRYGVIDKIPPSLGNRVIYMAIEEKMRRFSKKIGIPLKDLDLLFWAMETGFVFK